MIVPTTEAIAMRRYTGFCLINTYEAKQIIDVKSKLSIMTNSIYILIDTL